MTTDSLYAGISISSGRRPFTYSALDRDLNLLALARCNLSEALALLEQAQIVLVGINVPSVARKSSVNQTKTLTIYTNFLKAMAKTGYKPFSQDTSKRWFETNAYACYHSLIQKRPLSRRTLEGRIQRAFILYEHGLRISDPMDFFEEITRHRMMMGVWPNELIHSASELDAFVAAYMAWLIVNRPQQVKTEGKFLLPAEELKEEL